MAEHWKSTPRYWCKHCSTYVRDTKLERQNHEATARHQGAVKRSLRELHRGKEAEDREKERARHEVERLNGVVSGTASSSSLSRTKNNGSGSTAAALGNGVLSESERKRQAEQLALMGVRIPQEFRGDLAMAGEWTVTATTVVEERPEGEDGRLGARARGVHKRDRTEEEQEEENAVKSLFKKPRRWGRDSRAVQGEEDLDALLSEGLSVKTMEEAEEDGIKKEETQKGEEIIEKATPEVPDVKEEEEEKNLPRFKQEDDAKQVHDALGGAVPVLAFKKRKPKNVRQK